MFRNWKNMKNSKNARNDDLQLMMIKKPSQEIVSIHGKMM